VPRYLDIEVTIVLSRRVWRRFLIHKGATFYELHRAIQDAFGWLDYHLFEFRHPGNARRSVAGIPDPATSAWWPSSRRGRTRKARTPTRSSPG
jgi:hypothetical protein